MVFFDLVEEHKKRKDGNKEKNCFPTSEDDQSDVCRTDGYVGDEYLQRGA